MNTLKITEITENPNNPRTISKENYRKLVKSLAEFPEMLNARPIVVNEDRVILGGNMRFRACKEAGLKEVAVYVASWSEVKQKQFVVKDNVSFGEWNFDVLANDWEIEELQELAIHIPTIKNTELLSELKYDPVYYEPEKIVDIKLNDCIDLDKFNAKMKALDEYNLSETQKDILKMFAYRYIKIDFESVANYYYFNASDEEKKAIERLRLVLTDSGVGGFLDDDLIRILSYTDFELND